MKMCLVFVAVFLSTLLILSFAEDIFKMGEKNIGWNREIFQRDTQSMVMSCMFLSMITNDKFLQKTDYSKLIVLNLLKIQTSIKFQYVPHIWQRTVGLKLVHFPMCSFLLYFLCVYTLFFLYRDITFFYFQCFQSYIADLLIWIALSWMHLSSSFKIQQPY